MLISPRPCGWFSETRKVVTTFSKGLSVETKFITLRSTTSSSLEELTSRFQSSRVTSLTRISKAVMISSIRRTKRLRNSWRSSRICKLNRIATGATRSRTKLLVQESLITILFIRGEGMPISSKQKTYKIGNHIWSLPSIEMLQDSFLINL
jgi:hypothetical protein